MRRDLFSRSVTRTWDWKRVGREAARTAERDGVGNEKAERCSYVSLVTFLAVVITVRIFPVTVDLFGEPS